MTRAEMHASMAGFAVPLENREPLVMWVLSGVEPGEFLQAVLVNDLRMAVVRASRTSMHGIVETVRWLISDAPSKCWGSEVNYHDWMSTGGWNGLDPNERKLAMWR